MTVVQSKGLKMTCRTVLCTFLRPSCAWGKNGGRILGAVTVFGVGCFEFFLSFLINSFRNCGICVVAKNELMDRKWLLTSHGAGLLVG